MENRKLDCSGLSCPLPIVRVSRAIKEIAVGDILEVLATDKAFRLDIEAWAKKTGNLLEKFEEADGKFSALIKKVL